MTTPAIPRRLTRLPALLRHGLLWHEALQFAAAKGLVVRPLDFFRVDLADHTAAPPPPLPQGLQIAELGPRDMVPLDRLERRRVTAADLRRRLDDRHRCFALIDGNQVASFVWFDFRWLHFEPCRRPLTANEAYLYDLHTLERYRGQGLAALLRAHTDAVLGAQGIRVVLTVTDSLNRPAIRAQQRCNARRVGRLLHVNVLGLQHTWTLQWSDAPATAAPVPA